MDAWELQQLKAYLNAMRQLLEAIEARDKAEQSRPASDGAPVPRLSRIP